MSLTKYESGSLKELGVIALPLMLSSLSLMLMIFIDRLLLAKYSTAALNAATNATTLGYGVAFGWISLAGIAEVFVAQYNGAGQKKALGVPVWQSIWLGCLSWLCFLPLSWWGGNAIYHGTVYSQMERDYFNTMMLFGPLYPLFSGLCAFWIGQGRTRLITWLTVVANIVNAGLDVVLIFGIEGWVPAMGVKGAAIATSLGSLFQVVVLFMLFLKKDNRQQFSTGDYRFQPKLFFQMLRVGLPNAMLMVVEVLGWAAFYATMTLIGDEYITIAAICQSVAILFWFFPEGLLKAVASIAGNMIGAGQADKIPLLIYSGIRMVFCFLALLLLLIIPFIDIWMALFLDTKAAHLSSGFDKTLALCLGLTALSLSIEGVRILFTGVLTAAGDTFFLCVGGSLSIWIAMYLPVYFIVYMNHAPIEVAFWIWIFYAIMTSFVYYLRYKAGAWRTLSLLNNSG